jgi:hypothetical protein
LFLGKNADPEYAKALEKKERKDESEKKKMRGGGKTRGRGFGYGYNSGYNFGHYYPYGYPMQQPQVPSAAAGAPVTPRPPMVYYNCNVQGHIARDCPTKPSASTSK